MKVAIIFYSFSGKTKKLCLFLKEIFIKNNLKVDLFFLKPKKEETSFLKQALQAFFKKRPEIEDLNFLLNNYEILTFASPVWAFTFSPPLHSFLEKINSLKGKKVLCFLTFGSGLGKEKALGELKNCLIKKGAEIIFAKNLQGEKIEEKDYLHKNLASLKEILNLNF